MSGAAGRCVGPSRPGRGRGRPWGKRGAAGAPRGRGAGRRATTSAWDTRCVSAERLRDCRRPRGRRAEADAAGAAGANGPEASETAGAAGSAEAAGDPGAVWVDGAVGEPQVVGPVGSVWVTGTGGEEDGAPYQSPRGCERKGRPGSMGHESILELWLKVQAMRAAAGCGEGSRVELHPVPAGEGPVDRGVPGRASWVETSRGGLTGPWVKGQARAMPRTSGVSTGVGPGAGCERVPGLCGRGQAAGLLPGGVPGMVPYLLGRGQAAGGPRLWTGRGAGGVPLVRGAEGSPCRCGGLLAQRPSVGTPRAHGEGGRPRGCCLMLWGRPAGWRRKPAVQVPWARGTTDRPWRGWGLGVLLARGALDSPCGCLVLLKRKLDVGVTQDSGNGGRLCG
ncbi:collagen alpha-2(I) chain-like [Felis catus]|uniref:collagen alpha-2(I) chain-like n=1 Tax=Felis catus TaxID=9685 RepID=UPI001D199727|nr:collagen alpha-2(I) chain-like [Felis catus]